MRSVGRRVDEFGLQHLSGGVIRKLMKADVMGMLLSVARRNATCEWRKEMCIRSQSCTSIKLIVECEVESSCAFLKSKVEGRTMLN